ncbi:hypothetical protein ACFVY4_33655 [Streptomyces sp. NPDC058299]|uniref:hypothetical protein n=1 Tax=Streptomyces sp. NPDC058299 TaxID=3346435 RepID=UPI0036EEEFC6
MTQTEIRHPALTGEPWPVIGVRVRRQDRSPTAASWRPAPHAALAALSHALLRRLDRAIRPVRPVCAGRLREDVPNRSALPGGQGVRNRPVAGSSSPHHCA